MSSYNKLTKHPITGDWYDAEWLDDYFGRHKYGVRFYGQEVFKADDYEWETKERGE